MYELIPAHIAYDEGDLPGKGFPSFGDEAKAEMAIELMTERQLSQARVERMFGIDLNRFPHLLKTLQKSHVKEVAFA